MPLTSLPVDRPNANRLERRPLVPKRSVYSSFGNMHKDLTPKIKIKISVFMDFDSDYSSLVYKIVIFAFPFIKNKSET